MTTDFELAKHMLTIDEGNRPDLYDDATGKPAFCEKGNITGGIGHNFNANPLSLEVIHILFIEDYRRAITDCLTIYRNFERLSQPRRLALINMSFQLGGGRLKGFKKMNEAINNEEWAIAAIEAAHSYWYAQVKNRATRVIYMLEHDVIHEDYLLQ